jgi:hypothetical protein
VAVQCSSSGGHEAAFLLNRRSIVPLACGKCALLGGTIPIALLL